MAEPIGAWLAISSSILTSAIAMVGVFQVWQTARLQRAKRLSTAALIAVRRTEATIVRPLLQQKLNDVVLQWVSTPTRGGIPDSGRMLLYCELCRCVRLTPEEKQRANQDAIQNLVSELRTMPSPPLRVHDPVRDKEHMRLRELVEESYQLRPRVSASVVQEFNHFCPSARYKVGLPS